MFVLRGRFELSTVLSTKFMVLLSVHVTKLSQQFLQDADMTTKIFFINLTIGGSLNTISNHFLAYCMLLCS